MSALCLCNWYLMSRKVQILSNREAILEALDRNTRASQLKIKAMFNSRLGGIITDQAFMSIPIDDHMTHRGHAVFDTLSIIHGRAFCLEQHLDRIIKSARQAKIELPMTKNEMGETLKHLAASTSHRYCKLRYWISAGPGNMYITPCPGMSAFYAIATEGDTRNFSNDFSQEWTVSTPLKPRYLATMKSTNYLLNALCALESEEKGGRFGVWTTEDGYIAESCIANIVFLLPGGRLVTPPFDDILHGTTVARILINAQELVMQGKISSVEQRPIHIDEAKTCIEMFMACGDSIKPVLA